MIAFHNRQNAGFTLIELVMVIVILGILAFILANILRGPMQAYVAVEKRARLVDIAETALQRMTREVRLALPNSIRVTGTTLEFLRTLDGGRYRGQGANRLRFNKQSDTFEFLGPLNQCGSILAGGAAQSDCLVAPRSAYCMVVYNTGQPGADAYAGDNIAAITGVNCGGGTMDFNLSPVAKFPNKSPRQRFFIVDTPVSYICNAGTGQIRRYAGYTIGGAVSGTGNLLVDQVSACSFSYIPGNDTRSGLARFSITITDTTLGQSVTLLQEAHVDNQP